ARAPSTATPASTASSASTSATATTPGPPPSSRPSSASPQPSAVTTAGEPSPSAGTWAGPTGRATRAASTSTTCGTGSPPGAAAICRHHGWGAKSVIGQLEWSDWKSDPRGFDMHDMRNRVAARLGSKPTSPAPAKPPTPATKPKVSLAHVVYAAKHDPAAAQ